MDNLRQLSGTGKLPGLSRNVPLGLYPGKGFITGGKGFNISGERANNRGKGLYPGKGPITGGRALIYPGKGPITGGRALIYPGKGLITGGRTYIRGKG